MVRSILALLTGRFDRPPILVPAICGAADVAATTEPGPPAVALARRYVAGQPNIRFDQAETRFHFVQEGLAVPAWILVPAEAIPADVRARAERAIEALGASSALSRIFLLGASYGMPVSKIAELERLPRWCVRRLLYCAIARLDG